MIKTFVYGFGAYEEFQQNITADIIKNLCPTLNHSSCIFDVNFDQKMFETALESIKPTHILGLGQSRQGEKLKLESRAINAMAKKGDTPIPIEPAAIEYIDTLSWQLPSSEICELSEDAGTYVCNYSMWVVSNWARSNNAHFAFLHIPHTFDLKTATQYVSLTLSKQQRTRAF